MSDSSNFSLSSMSGRRKIALLIGVVLLGWLVADPDFLADDPQQTSDQLIGEQSEFDSILSRLDEPGNTPQEAVIAEAPIEVAAVPESDFNSLAIPTESAIPTEPIRNVSFPDQFEVPAETPSFETEAPGNDGLEMPFATPSDTPKLNPRIRLSGAIFPVQ